MEYRTATELATALRLKDISATELLDETIRDIETRDSAINAVVVRDFDRARDAAKAADKAIGKGETKPLTGLPMTVKEAFHVAGLPATWGIPGTEKIPIAHDAAIVERLKSAGAIIIGKTNVAMMLADWQSSNPVYGTTNNPYDVKRTSGGSSGGSAAALAAGFVSLEYGSDLSASLRAPAHFCGVYAHKPTYDITPRRGAVPPGVPAASPPLDLAVVGPMARSAADLALALDLTAGADLDAKAWHLYLPPPRHKTLKDFRVLVLDTHPLLPIASSIRTALNDRAEALVKLGCKVAHESPLVPDLKAIAATFLELLLSIFTAQSSDEEFAKARAAADALPAGIDPLAAAVMRGSALSHRDWLKADRTRFAVGQQWRALFDQFDVVLCPAMPTNAFPHMPVQGPRGETGRMLAIDGAQIPYEMQPLWANMVSLTGHPATVAPIGFDADGLPIGIQIMGPHLEDRTTIEFAALMEKEFGGFKPPKG